MCGDRMERQLVRDGLREEQTRSDCWIYDKTISNKVDHQHLIFNSNSTTYVAKYAINKKWLNLCPLVPRV